MVEEFNETDNQSAFNTAQAMLQTPPVVLNQQTPKQSWKKTALIGCGVVFLLMVLLVILLPPRRTTITRVLPTPTPAITLPATAMQQQLDGIQSTVNNTNPDNVLVSPPQVDMQVSF